MEHFHPKSQDNCVAGRRPNPNWAYDWNNLLAVCPGGSHERSGLQGSQQTCDRPKGGHDHCDEILDPLTLPAEMITTVGRGSGLIDVARVTPPGTDRARVARTIATLNLNAGASARDPSSHLTDRRLAVLRAIEAELARLVSSGSTLGEAQELLARARFRATGEWPEFFSAVREVLQPSSDRVLADLGYAG